MPSQIDASVPVFGKSPGPTTASVRLQFERAARELSPLIDANLPARITTAEGNVTSLLSRMSGAETRITAIEATGPGNGSGDGVALASLATRVTLAEGNITSLQSRMGTAEGSVTSLLSRMGTAEGKITALEAAGPGGSGGLPTTGGNMTGALGINTSGTASTLPSTTNTEVALGLAGNNYTALTIDAASAAGMPRILLRRAGGSVNAPTNIPTGQQMGIVGWQGYFGNAWAGGGSIECLAQGTWAAGNMPTRMNFLVTRTGGTAPVLTMWLGVNGGMVVGNPGGGDMGLGTINVSGPVYLRGDVYIDGTLYIKEVPVPQP